MNSGDKDTNERSPTEVIPIAQPYSGNSENSGDADSNAQNSSEAAPAENLHSEDTENSGKTNEPRDEESRPDIDNVPWEEY